MARKGKKHQILGGIKVNSNQLSEWGKTGGRPQLYSSNSERAKAFRLRKKQERLGEKVELRDYKSYGEVQAKKTAIICPHCGKVETDLRKYFNEKGEYIRESYWFDTVKMEKFNVRENQFHCKNCSNVFSFFKDEMEVKEVKTEEKRGGSSRERWERWRGKSKRL